MSQTSVQLQAGDALDAITPAVQRSMDYCRDVSRKRARNFYYGLKLTPGAERAALYVVYAFMRTCDDLVDEAVGTNQTPLSVQAGIDRVEAFRRDMVRVIDGGPDATLPEGEVWPAFQYVINRYPIEPAHLHAMLDGQRCDMIKHTYETFDELYDYCYNVASVVGLVCISVWGAGNDPIVRRLGEYRGIALQLTNILRDVVEDAQRGRVYIPADELRQFGYDGADFKDGVANEAFDKLMAFQLDRARRYYEMSSGLEKLLPAAHRPTCWAIMRIYRGLFDKIVAEPRRVLYSRVRLSSLTKASIAMRAKLHLTSGGR